MAQKVRLDELEANKLDENGDQVAAKTAREIAVRMVTDARAVMSKVPASSPFAGLIRDQLIAEASRMGIAVAALIQEDDLRIVCEVARIKLASIGGPQPSAPSPPVPLQPVPPVRIRGLKPSPSNTWVVREERRDPPYISVGNGQVTALRTGAIIELRHYSREILQGIVDQGVKLIPIEESDKED